MVLPRALSQNHRILSVYNRSIYRRYIQLLALTNASVWYSSEKITVSRELSATSLRLNGKKGKKGGSNEKRKMGEGVGGGWRADVGYADERVCAGR